MSSEPKLVGFGLSTVIPNSVRPYGHALAALWQPPDLDLLLNLFSSGLKPIEADVEDAT